MSKRETRILEQFDEFLTVHSRYDGDFSQLTGATHIYALSYKDAEEVMAVLKKTYFRGYHDWRILGRRTS